MKRGLKRRIARSCSLRIHPAEKVCDTKPVEHCCAAVYEASRKDYGDALTYISA